MSEVLKILDRCPKLCIPPPGTSFSFFLLPVGRKKENERTTVVTKETIQITDRTPIPWTTKINPIWWLHGPDGWQVPAINNGLPYLPEVHNIWLRRFYWFVCRNPLMNFVGYVIGVEDKNYSVTGSAPVLRTTGRDCDPPQLGWRWAILKTHYLRLPFISYWNGTIEFYLGWRPSSGGFGIKFVMPKGN